MIDYIIGIGVVLVIVTSPWTLAIAIEFLDSAAHRASKAIARWRDK